MRHSRGSVSGAGHLEVRAPMLEGFDEVLTPAALEFLAGLIAEFEPRVNEILARRIADRNRIRDGQRLDFLPETAPIREADWTVAPIPRDLEDRRVEITGPTDRKMIINALNSGANVFMADFEDSNAPTWANLIEGQRNLRDAVRRSIRFEDGATGKKYALADSVATLVARPRGWHLPEAHVVHGGRPSPASLVDFGLYFFHNARSLVERGTGPYFYLPKLRSHLEARLWNDVFLHAQSALGLPAGTIRATVLIETLPAAFQMDEILYELREHAAGLNCGRWDYIFSTVQMLGHDPRFLLPDRGQITMEQHFLRSYTRLLIRTCHRRGIHAMGGMAAQIPIKGDPEANERALAQVRTDKLREVTDGHDGTWVAHPGLVALAREIFDRHMPDANQIGNKRLDVTVSADDLLEVPKGTRTEEGLRRNLRIGVRYLAAWLGGSGCVPLEHLMEDAATAEISRAQVWQWLHHRATLEDGRAVTPELFHRLLEEEMGRIRALPGRDPLDSARLDEAQRIFTDTATGAEFEEYLTIPAYAALLKHTIATEG